ncbi:MAG: hypothetical protein RO257_14065 [Candidatus Kapabacteria bacterium]|nr:hypothetical protein [Candidatus Kapabacteria bacterium]
MQLTTQPETDSLKIQISAFKEELSILVQDYELLVNFTCKNIESEYLKIIGQQKIEMLYLDFEARRLKRKIELIQTSINTGEIIDLAKIEVSLETELQEWKVQFNDFIKKYNSAINEIIINLDEKESKEIKRVFRLLSKKLHPDINPNLPVKFANLWTRVFNAYKNADLDELLAIEQILLSAEIPDEYKKGEDLERQLIKLEKAVNHYILKIEKVKEQYPYILLKILEDENLLNIERTAAADNIQSLMIMIDKYSKILNTMGFGDNVKFNLN